MSGAERTEWPRIPASLLSNVTASIIAGPDVTLVNLSRGGALMEVAARYPMRSKVRLKLARPDGGITQVIGTVSWAKVASISNGKIIYLLAVIFENPIEDLATATGLADIENQAGVLMVTDPFENTDAPAASLTVTATATPEAPDPTPLPVDAAEPEFVEQDLSDALFPSRAGLTPPLTVEATTIDGAAGADGLSVADREALALASARADELRLELDRAAGELAELAAANDNLSTQLQAYDEDRIRLRSELEAARLDWEGEKSALTRETVETIARVHELQAALAQHQQSGGQARADQQALAQSLSTRLEALEAERASLRSDLTFERQQWEADRAVLAGEAAGAVARANELQAGLEQRDRESQGALAEARSLQQALQNRLASLEAERAGLINSLEGERRSWHEERAALVSAVAEAHGRAAEFERALQDQHGSGEHALASARAHRQELEARLAALDAERSEWANRFDHERETWQQERQALASAMNGAQARVEDLEGALRAHQDTQGHLLEEARAHHHELQLRLDAIEADRAEAVLRFDSEKDAWQQDLLTLAAAVSAAQARVTEVESARQADEEVHARIVADARAERDALQLKLGAAEGERSQLTAAFARERQAWQDECLALAAALSQAAVRAADLESAQALEREAHERLLAEAGARHHDLQTRLQAFDQERADWGDRLQTERQAWHEERIALAAAAATAAAAVTTLEASIQERESAHAQVLAAAQAHQRDLEAQLVNADAERVQIQRELQTERGRWDAERAALLAEASVRSEEFQAALDLREQVHAEAIAREGTKFEELIAELMQAANDQQAEYQQLMAERTAAFEEQVSRVERVHAELARVRGEFEQQRAALDAHCRQLEARAASAEALSVAHETRHREVCREAERLVALLAPAPAAAVVDQQATLFTGTAEAAQAVA